MTSEFHGGCNLLAGVDAPALEAMEFLVDRFGQYKSNKKFLDSMVNGG